MKKNKKVVQFSELSDYQREQLRKKVLKRSYKRGTWLLNNVRCVRPSIVRFSDLSDRELEVLERDRLDKSKKEGRDLLEGVICYKGYD